MQNTLFVILATLVLSGCSVHRVAGEIGGVDVEASRSGDHDYQRKHDYDGDERGFCPPGQAKKGNCR
ncbi:membrane lipoprotein lipid attachment site-containing protein [Marinomonas fungiae]|uniref:Lipoprotein n=1 Tax=Marinomonas fungiae TaxID=1137284 RepID=A0A0K6IQV6_9GAMM|nr:membrane lipoprotein lipid attachment site-containing protein [Marinomonas fungiae]CUB05474.1 hypothetical protein Ga0061065_11164 [Marinomonas fungiae]